MKIFSVLKIIAKTIIVKSSKARQQQTKNIYREEFYND